MEATEKKENSYMLIGGHLALDFTNSIGGRLSELPGAVQHDFWSDYSRLVEWSRQVGALSDEEAQQLQAEATSRPDEAQTVVTRAVELRESIYQILLAAQDKRVFPATDLEVINRAVAGAMQHIQIVPTSENFKWSWKEEKPVALDRMLWPVVWAAAELFTTGPIDKIRRCGGKNCGWLFLDLSRNHSRQWCDMKTCGNLAKARRHYQRKRSAAS